MGKQTDKVSNKTKLQYINYHNTMKTYNDFVAFDIEATGNENYEYHKIIQISAVRFRNNEEVDEIDYYVNPQKRRISPKVQDLTGITPSVVALSPTIDDVLPQFLEFIGDDVLVSHNSLFDMRFLLYNMFKMKIPYKEFYVVDTLEFARNYIKQENGEPLKNYDLLNLVKYLDLDDNEDFIPHNALEDSRMAGRLYIECNKQAILKISNELPYYNYINSIVDKRQREYQLFQLITCLSNILKQKK